MCLIDKGFTSACGGFALAGGLAALYIANKEDVVSITKSTPTAKYDTITMAVGKVFYKFDFAKDSANFTQATEIAEAGVALKQTLVFGIPNYNDEQAERISQFAFAKVLVIAETRQGIRVILGLDETSGLELETIEQSTGSAQTDANRTIYTISTYVGEPAPEFSVNSTIPLV